MYSVYIYSGIFKKCPHNQKIHILGKSEGHELKTQPEVAQCVTFFMRYYSFVCIVLRCHVVFSGRTCNCESPRIHIFGIHQSYSKISSTLSEILTRPWRKSQMIFGYLLLTTYILCTISLAFVPLKKKLMKNSGFSTHTNADTECTEKNYTGEQNTKPQFNEKIIVTLTEFKPKSHMRRNKTNFFFTKVY